MMSWAQIAAKPAKHSKPIEPSEEQKKKQMEMEKKKKKESQLQKLVELIQDFERHRVRVIRENCGSPIPSGYPLELETLNCQQQRRQKVEEFKETEEYLFILNRLNDLNDQRRSLYEELHGPGSFVDKPW